MKTEVLICITRIQSDTFLEILEREIKRKVAGREVIFTSPVTEVGTAWVCVTVIVKNE